MREGRFREARFYLAQARDLDPRRMRASTRVNDLIRRMAKAEGATLIDLEGFIDSRSPTRIPGWSEFQDQMHVLRFDLEAEYLLRVLGISARGKKARFGQPHFDYWGLRSIMDRVQFPDTPAVRAALIYLGEARLDWLQKAVQGYAGPPHEKGLLLICLSEAFWRRGRRADAFHTIDEAFAVAPKLPEVPFQRALLCLRQGERREAVRWLRACLALAPGDRQTLYFLGRLSGQAPSTAGALLQTRRQSASAPL